MATTRIHDLAAEFGMPSEQLIGMLKEMEIFVRSHLTPLQPEQVALMRARWEREKRKQKEPPTPTKRRNRSQDWLQALRRRINLRGTLPRTGSKLSFPR